MNTRTRRWCALAAAGLTLACRAGAQDQPDWSRPTEPFRIVGNVYWVGTHDLSSYLITAPEGHIVINTGLADSVSQIRANIERLGFRVSDVKILTATHAHWDHVAGLAALKKMTGARVYMSEPDADVLESGGKSDFRWGRDPRAWFDPVAVDRRLRDGETIKLGANSLTLHIHAGHSKGASSFTFTVRDGARDYRVGIINMGSINPGVRVSGMPGFPDIGNAYARSFAAQKAMVLDVFLSSHASQFGLHQKRQQATPTIPTGSWIRRDSARRWTSWRRAFESSLRRSSRSGRSTSRSADRRFDECDVAGLHDSGVDGRATPVKSVSVRPSTARAQWDGNDARRWHTSYQRPNETGRRPFQVTSAKSAGLRTIRRVPCAFC